MVKERRQVGDRKTVSKIWDPPSLCVTTQHRALARFSEMKHFLSLKNLILNRFCKHGDFISSRVNRSRIVGKSHCTCGSFCVWLGIFPCN